MIVEPLQVIGDENIRTIMRSAPRAMTRDMRKWMFRERRRLVGNKAQPGKIRTFLMRKSLRQREGTWSPGVAKAFKGFIKGRENLDQMAMHMGVGFNAGNPFTQGLAKMEERHTISKTRGLFVVPVWTNLVGEGIRYRQNAAFRRKLRAKELDIVYKNGRAYYFDRATNKLLWIGVKHITIPQQFKFGRTFRSDTEAIKRRAANQVKRTLRAIERGYKADR